MAILSPTDPANLTYYLKDGGMKWPNGEGFSEYIIKAKISKPDTGSLYLVAFRNPDTAKQLVLRGETEKEGDRPLYVVLDENSPAAQEIINLKRL